VENSPVHVLDYNPFISGGRKAVTVLLLMIYEMKRFWFNTILGIFMAASLSAGTFLSLKQTGAYQAATPTLPGIYAAVTYTEQVNIRGGPSTVYYPIVGHLLPGAVVPALGVSPGREWVQIAYPDAPGGVGWVYAIYVSISGGEPLVVEAPLTPTPPVTATIDATLSAAFNFQPTPSRLPTFTPPPPLVIPQFTETETPRRAPVAPGIFVISLALLGVVGMLVSFALRK
jgi:uncharacterized protein YraI